MTTEADQRPQPSRSGWLAMRRARLRAARLRPDFSALADIWIPLVIGIVSILVAIVALRASDAGTRASQFERLAFQERTLYEQVASSFQGRIGQDEVLLGRYLGHLDASQSLSEQADAIRAADPEAAQALDREASDRLALSRSLRRFFWMLPAEDDPEYDPAYVLEVLVGGDRRLDGLDPERTTAAASVANHKALRLSLVAVLLVASLVFLTVGQVARRGRRGPPALAGVVVATFAAGVFFATEVALR